MKKLLGLFLICCLTIGAMIQLTFGRKPIKIKDLHKIEDIPDTNKKLSFSIKQKKIKKISGKYAVIHISTDYINKQ